jgi:hypothetical protein
VEKKAHEELRDSSPLDYTKYLHPQTKRYIVVAKINCYDQKADAQLPSLMQIYSLGYIAIYFLFMLMYTHAYKRADFLGLMEIEKFDCKTNIYKQVILGAVGLSSLICTLVLPLNLISPSGFIYILIGPALTVFFFREKKSGTKNSLLNKFF